MREFVLYSNKGRTGPDFTLKDLPGSGGRMDLVARCVISALWLSRKMRKDSRIYISLNGPPNPTLALRFDGGELERVAPDERNVAIWIKKVLKRGDMESREWRGVHDGVSLSSMGFKDIIGEMRKKQIYLLHEGGKDVRDVELSDNPVFVLGDHMGLPENEKEFLERRETKKISLGPESYFSSQSITLVHNELDRR